MSTPKKLTAAGLITALLAAIIWIANQASANNANENRLKGTDICIPDEYAVPLPTASGSQTDSYDTYEGYGVSVSIDRQEASQRIDGYREIVEVNGHRRYQGIYFSLHPVSEESLKVKVKDPETLTGIDQTPDLFIKDFDPTPLTLLEVLEKEGNTYRKWGYCSRFTSQNGDMVMECDRDYLRVGPLRIKYTINQAQLHLHDEIDQFIKEKISQWRCQ